MCEMRGSKEGPGHCILALQRGVLDAKVVIFPVFFDDFQKHCFFKGGLQGGFAHSKKRWVSRLEGPWGLPGRRVVAPCGSLGAPGTMVSFFFGARGVPLERPRYVPLQIMSIKHNVF